MKCSVIVATNDRQILEACLLASPDLASGLEVVVETGALSAGLAYNAGARKAGGDILLFVHQDVFLPAGWMDRLAWTVKQIGKVDPQWAVMGVFGIDEEGHGHGHLYSTGLRRIVGAPLEMPARVRTLDEVVLVVRRSAKLQFDEMLPGFHLYATDLCLQAQGKGYGCYAFEDFCIHNTNGIKVLPKDYWTAYGFMRRKWASQLPIVTPCMTISRWGIPALGYRLRAAVGLGRKAREIGRRVSNPAALCSLLDYAWPPSPKH